ncbi:hypothetical protein [Bacillus vallismortis]|uniref:hypothetical protein n=1 Tax=Bacillus vallismortis TaxID=72361 RepID=UPI00228116E9|nr:hypothetical protein [Bacillus vallismortis]MCY7915991.1 hypothetical protein [Bacillus vallismortis]
MKKLIVLTLSMLLLLSACGTSGQSEDKTSSNNKNAASEETVETVTKEGSFVGLADSHTIAVNIDGKETTLQVDEDLQDKVNSIEEGKKVEVQYTKGENGVLELKSIETK